MSIQTDTSKEAIAYTCDQLRCHGYTIEAEAADLIEALAAERDALTAERDAARRRVAELCSDLAAHKRERQRLLAANRSLKGANGEEAAMVTARIAELEPDADRYAWLRTRDLDTIQRGGVFAGMVPNGGCGGGAVLNGEDLDHAIDAAMCIDLLMIDGGEG